ncbi:hypothetical protein K504DRAFT_371766 [Pleomassaria siparia CBS 279.74]|uniref:Phytochrome-like histidine kinase PHY1p n=1 Tax=Pleomassaria siparia CBS 279.74 TaxID=1314801 RepID=A0A6G1KM39_9PLEO|nr:hypothetical protein K504DRAFT_371766 [Pleomassaria siparia CBS 279.74]
MSQSPKLSPQPKPESEHSAHGDSEAQSPPASPEPSGTPRTSRPVSPERRTSPPHINTSVLSASGGSGALSPSATDRVFPIRSVVSVNSRATPGIQRSQGDYFHQYSRVNDARRMSQGSVASQSSQTSQRTQNIHHQTAATPSQSEPCFDANNRGPPPPSEAQNSQSTRPRLPAQILTDIVSARVGESERGKSSGPSSMKASSTHSGSLEDGGGVMTHRFKHIVTEGGHAVITGRDGDTLQHCEDEPIRIPGAVQGFGLLIALQEDPGGSGSLPVRIVSENSKRIIGRTPRELFALETFTDILSEEQADNLLDHIDFIKDEDADVTTNGPEVFTMSVKIPNARSRKLWCAIHMNESNPGLVICEFELEDDQLYPLVAPNDLTPEPPEDTLSSNPTAEEFLESTQNKSRPLRVLRSARKRKGEAAAMEVFNIMSQVQEQLASAPSLEQFLKVLVGVIKELTGFHRVMIYQFDQSFNGRVVTELVDPRATKDLYKGLNFPASDIPKQARDLYKINKVRMLYDRDQETARLVCRTTEDLENPLDLTHSYLRAMSPIHRKYLANMAVRSSMSISINAFNELWGLIACHSYGSRGMRVSFPIRKMCRLVGDSASRNIERLSYASRLQARKLINTVPTQHNPSGYIIASSDDLLKLFDADFGLLSIRDETKILGQIDQSQEALAMLEYLRMRKITSVMTSQDIADDFPDLRYPPGFQIIAGMLIVPLSVGGNDFIVFFRRGQLKEVKWAGNPYEKFVQEGSKGYLEPRKSFKMWSETVVGRCRDWTEEEVETAAVLCLVYGKFIEVWRQKEAALQSSQLTRLLLANSAHEVRTPLNAIINYLEIALEGTLDTETRENLARSHSASKSLIYVINDLLDLTKTEEGGSLFNGESFHLMTTLKEATDMFSEDAKRKGIDYQVIEHPGLPQNCIGDQRRVRQAISNITANAIENTTEGSIKVEMYIASWPTKEHVDIEVSITDTGVGMNAKKLDQLFNDLEQVQSESDTTLDAALRPEEVQQIKKKGDDSTLGLGLAVVARIIKNMNGQLRLKSEEGKGSRFVIQFPFNLPECETKDPPPPTPASEGSITPQGDDCELMLVAPGPSRNDGGSINNIAKKGSADSLRDKGSMRSFKSGDSGRSQRSDVDRLIEAIQEPHLVNKREQRSHSMRLTLKKRNSLDKVVQRSSSPQRARSKSLEAIRRPSAPPHQSPTLPSSSNPGNEPISGSGFPLKAVKIPEEFGAAKNPPEHPAGAVTEEVFDDLDHDTASSKALSPEHMRVLVAEDDLVNSKIVKKRLEKLGHIIHLTINGEQCADAFAENPQGFDVVLMDMQMPIVNGMTSCQLIRSFEKTHADTLSPRAAQYGRIPIIAVSASLLEKSRRTYIDAGFDAWILKPISFPRLTELMAAIVDTTVRDKCVYVPGQWERGGWFHNGYSVAADASAVPSGDAPQTNPSKSMETAASSQDAGIDGEAGDMLDEQRRPLQTQERDKGNVVDGEEPGIPPVGGET